MIFDPERKDLEPPVMSEIDNLMKKTKHIRPNSYKIKDILNLRNLAYAASFAVVCILSFQFFNIESSSNVKSSPEQYIPTQMRGERSSGAIAVSGSKQEEFPLAYLVDIHGEIKISSVTKHEKVPASCEVLFSGDIVTLSSDASAKIIYSDAVFEIAGPQKYQVENPNPTIFMSAQKRGKAIDPVMTTRGNHLGTNNTPSIVIPPKTLMATVVAPITRAGDSINVYSPKGASYTDKPIIKIGGDSKQNYSVSILDMEGNVIGKSITIPGGAVRCWSELSSAPIKEDEVYTLRIQLNGKIVNDANNASFWLLPSEERASVDALFASVVFISSSQYQFFQAHIFYMNGCYAEAFSLLEDLSESGNLLMKLLLKLCKIKLKIQEK